MARSNRTLIYWFIKGNDESLTQEITDQEVVNRITDCLKGGQRIFCPRFRPQVLKLMMTVKELGKTDKRYQLIGNFIGRPNSWFMRKNNVQQEVADHIDQWWLQQQAIIDERS